MLRLACGVLLLCALTSCKKHPIPKPNLIAEEVPEMRSAIMMGDAKAAGQLDSGFYGIESESWRWTKKEFSAILETPPTGATKGAELVFRFHAVPQLIDELKQITMKAKVGGVELPAQTFNRKGDQVYRQAVPPSALAQESVKIEFSLDKALAPKPGDGRELGVVAVELSLVEK